jgi:hydroxypyruvate isomerase
LTTARTARKLSGMSHSSTANGGLSRRRALQTAAVACAGASLASQEVAAQMPRSFVEPDFKIRNQRIRQSIMGWTYNPMPAPELAKLCKDIGLVAMEGMGREHYPMIKELGLQISLVSSHGFAKGPFSRANHESVIKSLREGIDAAVKFGCPKVITFTGMREKGISDEEGVKNCLDAWKQVIGYAEEKKVTLCLEHLNSRDSTHPMKGHPGYFGDHVDFCVELIKRMGSPNFKLLLDIYHVAIMDGDVIRRLRQHKEYIGHIHTAGVPGRAELDDTQEVNYPAVMRAVLEIGYTGHVAQEFIPTWPDRALALRHAAKVCDV